MILLAFLGACHSVHGVMALSDATTEAQKQRNARKAASVAANPGLVLFNQRHVRAGALESLGRLRYADNKIIADVLSVLHDAQLSDVARSRAAWSLGELGRDLKWGPKAKAIHQGLLDSLDKSLTDRALYHVIEAIAKVYIHHPHSTEENLETIRAFNSIRNAKMGEARPLFTLVRSRIETIDVLIVLLNESIETEANGEARTLSVYRASLDLLRFIDSHQNLIVSDFETQKEKIKEAFSAVSKGFSLNERVLTVMMLWYLSRSARSPEMTKLLESQLLSLKPAHSSERLLLSRALAQLQSTKSIKSALLTQLNGAETNAKRLAVLCGLRFQNQDLIQHTLDIKPSGSVER